MFVDHRDWPPPPPWRPEPRKPKLSPREERVLRWVIGVNLMLLLLAPLAGGTVIEAVAALLHYR